MAYDEDLADRIRGMVATMPDVTEKKMFGGLAFLNSGKMFEGSRFAAFANLFCGVMKDELMVRVGAERHAAALKQRHVRPMDFTGRPLKGFVYVALEGLRTDGMLATWVQRSLDFVDTLVNAPAPRPRATSRKPRA